MYLIKDQAMCMFFAEECCEENVKKLSEKLETYQNMELCFLKDSKRPVLAYNKVIYGNPFDYRFYLTNTQHKTKLTSSSSVAKFVKYTFSSNENLRFNEGYIKKAICMTDIYQAVLPFTELWNNISSEEVEMWLEDHGIDFPKHEVKKRKTAKEKTKTWELFALKDAYLDDLAHNIERSHYN
ncbi:unnamed protein product [Rhizopus stolonifer]